MAWSQDILRSVSRKLYLFFTITDALLLFSTAFVAYYLRFQQWQMPDQHYIVIAIALIVNYLVCSVLNIYWISTRTSWTRHFKQIVKGTVASALLLIGLAYIFKSSSSFSRIWFMTWMFLYFLALILNRYLLFTLFDFMRSRGLNQRLVAIIGDNPTSDTLMKRLDKTLWTGYKIAHVWTRSSIPQDLQTFVQKHQIDEIWIVLPLKEIDTIRELMTQFRELALPIRMMLNAEEFAFFECTITDIAGFPALNLNASPIQGINRLVKELEDRLLALTILVMISPLLLTIALAVKLTSKGPVFFKQKRLGWDGKVIKVYKFRTMYEHKEAGSVITQATANDQRITPLGRFLRKTSLDELPQFINVLQGRMSIVGPRPHALSHNDEYKKTIYAYMQRHRVKPGITGWAQINGWRGETDTLFKMEKRVEYDLYYINNWSLGFDCKIILLTIFRGFVHHNAY